MGGSPQFSAGTQQMDQGLSSMSPQSQGIAYASGIPTLMNMISGNSNYYMPPYMNNQQPNNTTNPLTNQAPKPDYFPNSSPNTMGYPKPDYFPNSSPTLGYPKPDYFPNSTPNTTDSASPPTAPLPPTQPWQTPPTALPPTQPWQTTPAALPPTQPWQTTPAASPPTSTLPSTTDSNTAASNTSPTLGYPKPDYFPNSTPNTMGYPKPDYFPNSSPTTTDSASPPTAPTGWNQPNANPFMFNNPFASWMSPLYGGGMMGSFPPVF